MIAQEISQKIKCPVCQWQITIYTTEAQTRFRVQCNRCNSIVLDWSDGKPAKDRPILETTLPKEMVFGKENAAITIPKAVSDKTNARDAINAAGLPAVCPSPLGVNAPPDAPKKVGDYTLVKLIGAGGMGEIYLAEHTGKQPEGKTIPNLVAIKLLSERIQTDSAARDRFLQEAQVHSRLCKDSVHPHIVQIYDVGYCPKSRRLYLVMEYIEGESLEKFLASRGMLSEKHSLQITIGVAHALDHAFKNRIIHRDLKPANILIDRKSRKAKVADLGLGKILEEKGITMNGEFMGTPYYMAPEQIRSAKDVDQQADIYALGATLYHMLAGRPPYGEYKGMMDILRAKIAQEPIPIKEFVPTLTDAVAAIIEKAMSRDKTKRYDTPGQMIEDIQKCLETAKSDR